MSRLGSREHAREGVTEKVKSRNQVEMRIAETLVPGEPCLSERFGMVREWGPGEMTGEVIPVKGVILVPG